jgi:hypothetical protein
MGFLTWLFADTKQPPPARQVAARAMVLSTIVCRAYLEIEYHRGIHEHAEGVRGLLYWLAKRGLQSELEPDELQFLETPVGQASESAVENAYWRSEGLGVLAWALQRFELPPYDQRTNPDVAQLSVGFSRTTEDFDLRKSGVLRPASEISRLASHLTIVSWRLRQFQAGRDSELGRQATELLGRGRSGVAEPMDFVGYLRSYGNFTEWWLEDLRILDGDLAMGATSIAEASPEDVYKCTSIAVQRQIAAYWLQGDDRTYSKVVPATLLTAC